MYINRCNNCNKPADGLQSLCTTCYSRKWRSENKDKALILRVKHRYGITAEHYNKCMATSTVCQICNTTKNLCYDHCHETDKFRGILCKKCNLSLGQMGDTFESIERFYLYLKNIEDKNKEG